MSDAGVAMAAAGGPDVAPRRLSVSLAERYQKLFDGTLLAIYVSRPDGRLLACNTAFAQMLGFDSIADAVATGIGAIHADEGERARFLARVKEHRRLDRHHLTEEAPPAMTRRPL